MKRITVLILGCSFLLNAGFAQQSVVLTFENHALQAGVNNSMILCDYSDPGSGGYNMTWDFSFLKSTDDFTGTVLARTRSKSPGSFAESNVTLDEFSNRFYFVVSPEAIEQIGYSAFDNAVVVTYDKPFVKMKFPFAMGDRYSGGFTGSMKTGSKVTALTGHYEVAADGCGKLLLPGMASADNTLRVKTVKSYEMQVNGKTHQTVITTWRWYGCCNRYPLLVLSSIKTCAGSSVSWSYQAAYNNVINTRLPDSGGSLSPSVRAFPNPVTDRMTLEYTVAETGEVILELFNVSGRKITTLLNNRLDAGTYRLELSPEIEGLTTGIYIVKACINNSTLTEEFIISR
ncbi:MAG: hypothetical protein A2Y87_10930 [Bacteroidetes bacterium RBG_13_46_8]|nr:MAG: hypothetical protein A2Y87_10930 [Bacteroidetes bacterium RBG_13_46_8]